MSGIYQNWLKVQNPDMPNNITPMESGGFQTPFFFGGSQVPNVLNLKDTDMDIKGKGLKDYKKSNFKPDKIKGVKMPTTDFKLNSNIHLPRHMGSLMKSM